MINTTSHRVRRRLAVAGAVIGLAASAMAATGHAAAAETATVANDTLTVSAGSGADRLQNFSGTRLTESAGGCARTLRFGSFTFSRGRDS